MREGIFYYPYPDPSFSENVKESIDFVNKFSAESLHSFADVLDAVNALRNLHGLGLARLADPDELQEAPIAVCQ